MNGSIFLRTSIIVCAAIVLLAYNGDPPNGRTGAPFDGHCNSCHNSGNFGGFNGVAEIVGLPDTILPSTTYALQFKVTRTAGSPFKAGFQLVMVDQNNNNAGELTSVNSETGVTLYNGRQYLEHNNGKLFEGSMVTWDFQWTAPPDADCNFIKLYYIVNFCNGDGSDFGDFPIAYSNGRFFSGGPSLALDLVVLQQNTCLEDALGALAATATGGDAPYGFTWSNGDTGQVVNTLDTGRYSVTLTDAKSCIRTGNANILAIDSLAPEMVCPEAIFSCAGDTVHYELPMVFDNCDLGPSESALISGLPSNTVFPPGIHTVIFQATDLLGNTSSCSFSIHVNTLPTVQVDTIIHDAGNGGTGYIGVSVEVGSGGMVQFTWEKDGAAFPAFTEDLDQLFSGTYRLTASDSNGCAVVLDSLVVENAVGIKEALWGSELLDIWPNPVAQGLFCIGGTFGKPESMVLINIEGQVVQAFPVASWPGPFYLPDLPVGLYVLCLRTSEGRVHRMRLVIGQ